MADYIATSQGRVGYALPQPYSATATYKKRDVVQYQGGSYVVLKDGVAGITPDDDGINYRILAGRGEAGESNAQWFTGAAVSGRGTGIVAGVVGSKAGDMYLNNESSDLYRASAPDTWDWAMNLGETVSITAENVPTQGGGTVQEMLDDTANTANRIYTGVDLTERHANEIAGHGGNPWAWIKARIVAVDFSGINVGDYIPFIAGGNSIMAEVAGIDTYYNYGDTATGHHIDFISRYLWPDRHVFNKVNYNNGTSASPSPWLASDLYAWLNSLSMSVPNSAAANPTLVAVNYTTTGVYDKLPTALKSVIVPKYAMLASRYTAGSLLTDDNSWAWRDMGKLWIPSEMEVFGGENWGSKNGYSGAGGYVQYPIFAQNARRVMATTGGTRNSWWLTTARGGYSASCGRISPAGHALYSDASATTVHVPVCFRIA